MTKPSPFSSDDKGDQPALSGTHAWLTPHVYIPVLIGVAIAALLVNLLVVPPIKSFFAFIGIPPGVIKSEPVNIPTKMPPLPLKGTFGFFTTKHTYQVTPVAGYAIDGRVLNITHYHSDRDAADLIPVDIGLGWNIMSDPDVLQRYFHFAHADTEERTLRWSLRVDPSLMTITPQDVIPHITNKHVIPADDNVYVKLNDLKTGDLVQLKGLLVTVSRPDDHEFRWIAAKPPVNAAMFRQWSDVDSLARMVPADTFLVTEVKPVDPSSLADQATRTTSPLR